MLQNRPSVQSSIRMPPPPTTYVPSVMAGYTPYQMLQNDYAAQELRQRNLSSSTEPPATPLLNSPIESFGVSLILI